jgi:hypothetical protein
MGRIIRMISTWGTTANKHKLRHSENWRLIGDHENNHGKMSGILCSCIISWNADVLVGNCAKANEDVGAPRNTTAFAQNGAQAFAESHLSFIFMSFYSYSRSGRSPGACKMASTLVNNSALRKGFCRKWTLSSKASGLLITLAV